MAQSNIQLKLVIDTGARRILYAEADKKFIDFLFALPSLSLGAVIRLLKTDQSMVGCLENLYESVEALNDTYLQPNQSKDSVLKPKIVPSSCFPALLTNVDSPTALKLYVCPKINCHFYVADDPKAICHVCRNYMSSQCRYVQPASGSTEAAGGGNEGGYVKALVPYMVMDDLSVKPMSTFSSVTLFNDFNVKDLRALQEKVVTVGVDEGVSLLRASLQSKTVLTDVFLGSVL